ncbi:MAG: T9SS type A sorting domain-containing protein, partial [Bacteroidetes bacterium]|nr:T9SS type A sorting domain-containing protein [Bacteroidota bacterium]
GNFGGAGAFAGNGIFKSTDNGQSWELLPSTSGIPPGSFTSDWQYVWNVAADPSSAATDEVYAATVGSIYKSTNGGTNWTQTLGSSTTRSVFTDVAVSSTGVVYAAGSFISGGPMNGVRRSTNGDNWVDITPPEFPPAYERIVITLAPSNQNVMYVAVQGVPAGEPGTVNKHQLWKYTYISGNGTGSGGVWENRGSNLPQTGQNNYGNFNEPFDTQEGYDLFMRVKPDNENFLVLCAVNMYVSTDAFATITNAKRIGGYQPADENGSYTNHHPDVHSGFFRPGSNVAFISGHDGGLSATSDITTNITANNPVSWQSLNNGYNVTQFYAVSLAPESGSNRILGGFQDNGSYTTVSGTLTVPWTEVNTGDGGYCAVAPSADNRLYSTAQKGDLQRCNLDYSNKVDMKPSGSRNPLFINPFALDKNNSSLLYFACGSSTTANGIWRNNNAVNGTTTTGWSFIEGTEFPDTTEQVSAIGISSANSPNVVYYGTDEGHIRKITDAGGTPVVSGNLNAGLPSGYVSCIAVDPENSDKAAATFSNYNIASVWYTTNGGTNWTNIEGNLSGTNGPSVRWAEIFYVQSVMHIILCTSTGVYYTNQLNGSSTVWTQEAVNSIGNVVCTMSDFRNNDKTFVVGTHGRGCFQTGITAPIGVNLISSSVPEKFALSQNYPNPFNPSTSINFEVPENSFVTVKIYDMLGKNIANLVNGSYRAGKYSITWNASSFPSGAYLCVMKSGNYSKAIKLLLVK